MTVRKTNVVVGATASIDGVLADQSGDLTAEHPDSSALGAYRLEAGIDSIDGGRRAFTLDTVPRGGY